jgi:hypothetical protein
MQASLLSGNAHKAGLSRLFASPPSLLGSIREAVGSPPRPLLLGTPAASPVAARAYWRRQLFAIAAAAARAFRLGSARIEWGRLGRTARH